VKVKRITTKQAAALLACHHDTVRRYAHDGLIRAIQARPGSATGKMWFDEREILAFAEGGAPAARAYRADKRKAGAKS
jgi:excisionase family DNA binding protein